MLNKYLMIRSLHNTVIFMKNNLNSKINFIVHVLVTTFYLTSNYPNVPKLLTALAKNLRFDHISRLENMVFSFLSNVFCVHEKSLINIK